MFRFDIVQNQWLLLALTGGIAALILFVLSYLGTCRPRQKALDEHQTQSWKEVWRFMPWFLIVSYAATVAFMLVYSFYFVKHPPNW
jgi:hypothetical protein